MRVVPLAAVVLVLTALLAPAAAGYAQPAFYFLKAGCPIEEIEGECYVPDAPMPTVPPLPPPVPFPPPPIGQPKVIFADGILDPYNFLAPNAPNSTEPDIKLVYPGAESALPVRFVTPANHTHPDRIKGSFLVGLWTGESPAPQANLTATLYEIKADGTAKPLANASVAIDVNASKAPNPTSVVPPNSTDPMTIVLHAVAQVAPLVLQPPLIFLLGPVDITFDNSSHFAIGLRLDPGSSPSPEPPGAATIRFNATLTPSFIYVPWYAPDPPRSSSTRSSTFSRSGAGTGGSFGSTGTGGVDDGDEGGKKGNGIPGFEMSLVVTMVALAAIVARRRL